MAVLSYNKRETQNASPWCSYGRPQWERMQVEDRGEEWWGSGTWGVAWRVEVTEGAKAPGRKPPRAGRASPPPAGPVWGLEQGCASRCPLPHQQLLWLFCGTLVAPAIGGQRRVRHGCSIRASGVAFDKLLHLSLSFLLSEMGIKNTLRFFNVFPGT